MKRWLTTVGWLTIAAANLARAASQEAPQSQEAPAVPAAIRAPVALSPELLAAFQATLAAKNYAFSCANENKGGGAPVEGEKRRIGAREATRFEGRWQAGAPTELKNGGLTGFCLDDQLVYRRGESATALWERFDDSEALVPRASGGDDEAPSAPRGTAGGAMMGGGTPMSGMMLKRNLMQLASTRPPHELLARLQAGGFTSIEQVEVDGRATWRGTLEQKLADEFAGVDRLRKMSAQVGRAGGGNADVTVTVELTLTDARIDTLTILTVVKTPKRGDSTRITRYRLHDFGASSYEVPKAVLDLLAT